MNVFQTQSYSYIYNITINAMATDLLFITSFKKWKINITKLNLNKYIHLIKYLAVAKLNANTTAS